VFKGIKISLVLLICSFLSHNISYSQEKKFDSFFKKSDTLHRGRVIGVSTSIGALWVGSATALGTIWYSKETQSKLHSFNDWEQWKQMDKIGHMTTAWYVSQFAHGLFQWSGLDKKKSIWLGGGVSLGYLTTVELMDGFSSEWGFSWSDMGFNTLGTALFVSQEFLFDAQPIKLKYSFHKSGLAHHRPNVLGGNFAEQLLKDYNGQTYWLSVAPGQFSKKSKFPKWITFDFGYSAQNMISGSDNIYVVSNGSGSTTFEAYRQYYISFGVDLSQIPVKSHFLKALFKTINVIKFPFPALEFNKHGVQFHPFYF
jgi:hypothetical protein